MALRHWLVFGLGLAVLAGVTPAHAQAPAPASSPPAPSQPTPSGPAYCVTYFEVDPAASRKTSGLLRQFAAATRKDVGNVEFLALHELGRPGRFAVVDAWRDKAALDAHGAAMKALGDKLQAAFASPFDARQFWTLSVAPSAGADMPSAVFVLTHVDVFPAGKEEAAALIKKQADDSRNDGGALRFDAVIQDARPNHFHLIEAWASRGVREAHALTDHSRQFRTKLVPLEGALYDERLYEPVR
jgi:quinol monooxygenase YgiN